MICRKMFESEVKRADAMGLLEDIASETDRLLKGEGFDFEEDNLWEIPGKNGFSHLYTKDGIVLFVGFVCDLKKGELGYGYQIQDEDGKDLTRPIPYKLKDSLILPLENREDREQTLRVLPRDIVRDVVNKFNKVTSGAKINTSKLDGYVSRKEVMDILQDVASKVDDKLENSGLKFEEDNLWEIPGKDGFSHMYKMGDGRYLAVGFVCDIDHNVIGYGYEIQDEDGNSLENVDFVTLSRITSVLANKSGAVDSLARDIVSELKKLRSMRGESVQSQIRSLESQIRRLKRMYM